MNHINNITKSRKFKQLNFEKRIQIQTLLNEGYSQTKIASIVGCDQSTISREIKRGSFIQTKIKGAYVQNISIYEANAAQNKCDNRNKNSRKKPYYTKHKSYIEDIASKIKIGWSFEMIVGRIRQQNIFNNRNNFCVCVTTLYNYLHKGVFKQFGLTLFDFPRIKIGRIKRFKPTIKRDCRGNSIDLRPEKINNRTEAFNWEIDLIMGPKNQGQSLLTFTERKTRFELAFKIKNKSSEQVTNVLDMIEKEIGLEKFQNFFKSITSDNGSEFLAFEKNSTSCTVQGATRTTQYYAHPYSAYERGTNEAMNACLRKKFPKKTKFENVKNKEIIKAIEHLNNRPKKCLGFKTALECIQEEDFKFLDAYEHIKKIVAF